MLNKELENQHNEERKRLKEEQCSMLLILKCSQNFCELAFLNPEALFLDEA